MSREHFLFYRFSSVCFTDTSICWILPSVLGGLPRQLEGLRSYSDLSFQEHVQSPTDSRASFATWSDSVRAALPYSTSLPEREKKKGNCPWYMQESWEASVGNPHIMEPWKPYEAERSLPILSAHNFISPDFYVPTFTIFQASVR